MHPTATATATATATDRRRALAVPAAALLLAALAAIPVRPAAAIAHDRLPGDDLGGSSALPVPSAIGEDARAPMLGAARPPAADTAPTAISLAPAPAG